MSKKSKIKTPVQSASSDTIGAYLFQNSPIQNLSDEGIDRLYQSHKKLKGHKVTDKELKRSSDRYSKEQETPKSRADGGKIGMSTDNSLDYTIKNQQS